MSLNSCISTKKYNHLQHQYKVLHAEKQTEKDDCEMQLNKKETQIQELLKHIQELETNIKKLEVE